MLNDALLALLRCPLSHARLLVAEDALLSRVNDAIRSGEIVNRGDEPVTEPLTAALVTEDHKRVYRVDDGIVRLLVDGAIELDQIAES